MDPAGAMFLAVADFIEEQGHRTTVSANDADPRIHSIDFKSKGLHYRVTMSEEDPGFFSVGLSYNLPTSAPAHDVQLQIAHDVAAAHKTTKLELEGASITLTVEQFFEGTDGFKAIFWRCVSALKSSSALLFQKLRIATPSPDPEFEAREAAQRFLMTLTRSSET